MRSLFVPWLVVLIGCSGSVETSERAADPEVESTPEVDSPPRADGGRSADAGKRDGGAVRSACSTSVIIDSAPVVELRAQGSKLSLTLADSGGAGDHALYVVLTQAGHVVRTLFDASAALGKLDLDLPELAPGAYVVEAKLGCPASATDKAEGSTRQELFVVRLGASKVFVGGSGRVPLLYHSIAGKTKSYYPLSPSQPSASFAIDEGEAELDDANGVARVFAAPWPKLDSPPVDGTGAVVEDGTTFPVSLIAGSKAEIALALGKTALVNGKVVPGGLGEVGLPDLRVVLDGAPAAEAMIADGDSVRFTLDAPPAENVGQYELTLRWHFEANDRGAWKEIASQTVTLKVYGVLGNGLSTAPPNLPWVAVVDEVTAEIAGKTRDPATVRKLLVRFVYEDLGLSYNRANGGSMYTLYGNNDTDWSQASFDLSAFLKRSKGEVVNCSDCASILSTYASMVGAELHYAIIGWDFGLNPIQGIGASTPGSPFDSGRRSFTYHAVATPDATITIDDATLALDGDDNPSSAPFVKKLVQDVPGDEYITRLSPAKVKPRYQYDDQTTSVD